MKILLFVELLGTISFAFSGAVIAMRHRLDAFGILIITFISSIGGGTLRDILIGSTPVSWMLDIYLIYTILATYFAAIFFHNKLLKLKNIFFWMDTFGLSLVTILAINKGIACSLHPLVCIALCTISGCFGGVLRDIVLNEIPVLFKENLYATACIAGGIIYFLSVFFTAEVYTSSILACGTIIFMRFGADHYKWNLPKFK
jgi:uncharacterized membrane protein YeiH